MHNREEQSTVNETVAIQASIKVSTRAYFSSYHLWAAKEFAVKAKEIEDQYTGNPYFDIRHRVYVMNSILSSAAFIEAAINELFQDAADDHRTHIESLPPMNIAILSDYWQMTEQKNKSHIGILDKYQLALRFCGHEPMNKGHNLYQNVDMVIKLRNTIVHYKPESISVEDKHNLSVKLERRFPENALMKNSGNPFFPDRCLGFGCAHWAAHAVKEFADRFFSIIGVTPIYKTVDFDAND